MKTSTETFEADLLIHARWVIPVDETRQVLDFYSVAVCGDTIVALMPTADAKARVNARQIYHLNEHALIPGLVNLHTHAAMSLLRGRADDEPLMQWLGKTIWPIEQRHVGYDFVRDGSMLAAAEMLSGGITTCNDMYYYPEATAEAFVAAGLRAVLGIIVVNGQTPYAADTQESIGRGLALRDQLKGEPLVSFALAPHAPYTVSDTQFESLAGLAAQLDLPVHIHVHETAQEIADALRQHHERPLARLARLGILGPQCIAVHAVHLDAADMALLQRYGCTVAHCPSSNLKLGNGIAPVAALRQMDVNVGLGTDSAASNNRLDLFTEMRLAALLAKGATGDAACVPAYDALAMATINGAVALGLERQIGSIETGKKADLCAVSFATPALRPCYDPVSHLVYAAGREHVSHVWVNGAPCYEQGRGLLQIDNSSPCSVAASWQIRLE